MHVPSQKPMHTKKRGNKRMTKENNTTLAGIVQNQIQNTINQQPHPTECTVTKVYEDGYVDINSPYGELRHIKSITPHNVGDETILIFLNNTTTERRVI